VGFLFGGLIPSVHGLKAKLPDIIKGDAAAVNSADKGQHSQMKG
jgi:hypothetical protein